MYVWWLCLSHCDGMSGHCDGTSCSCKSKLQKMFRKYFGFSSFRPGQMEASLAVLHGKDFFVRMATGSGKSLCKSSEQE